MLVNKKTAVIGMALLSTILFAAGDCDGAPAKKSAAGREDSNRTKTYESLVDSQPARTMKFSPTRQTKNFWIDTWDEKGKLAYVYLLNSDGKPFGYYITEGLPVTYCTGLIPPYQFVRADGGEFNQDFIVPGPSVDGTFSSGSNCSTYYAKDATSGAYIEYTAGFGINPFVYDQPMQQFREAEPLGDATVANVR